MADTSTVGGVISGYCAIGSRKSAIPPASVTTMDSTEAKIGRSMKKRVNMREFYHRRTSRRKPDVYCAPCDDGTSGLRTDARLSRFAFVVPDHVLVDVDAQAGAGGDSDEAL